MLLSRAGSFLGAVSRAGPLGWLDSHALGRPAVPDWYIVFLLRENMVCVELFWEAWLGVGLLVLGFLPFCFRGSCTIGLRGLDVDRLEGFGRGVCDNGI